MTEEIIIDGVDVSGCDRLRKFRDWAYSSDKWCGISNDGGCECEQNINCLYKQLKRAEIEIEKLKGVDRSVHPDSAYYKIARLEQENRELKAYKDVNEDFKKAWDELNEKHKRYSSALDTIQKMILSAWEQGKYLDGGLYECLTKEFSKINGI